MMSEDTYYQWVVSINEDFSDALLLSLSEYNNECS